ncbi:MAG TPA: FecR family protein [Burkholderiales bacterium]|nr:FecR family protein [Burkholderiales bacterium]
MPVLSWAAEGGKFQFVTGDVQVLSADGKHRVPVKGDSFSTGDTIVTGASGTAQIRMNDGGLMAVRANTQLKLDQYIFNGREDGNERSLISLIKGGFRTITGLIGNRNKENYRILTPSATIGIRGTDHEPFVVPAGATGGFQEGTYDRVYRGATIITTDKGKLIVNPNQVGFTPGKGAAPVILPKIPEFYDVKPQLPNASKDGDKGQQDAGDATTTTTTKSDAIKSLSTTNSLKSVREVDTDTTPTTTLKSNLSTTNLKALSTDTLTTPLVDTTRATTTIDTSTIKSDVLTVPTTTLKSTTSLTTTPATNAVTTPVTTVTTPITTTIVAPVTTTIVAPVTTTITTPVTTITTPVTKSLDTTLSVPTTTIQKITR